jgi:hypothetical protein
MTGTTQANPPPKPAPPAQGFPKGFSFGMSVIRKSQDDASQNRRQTVHHG